MKHISSLLFKLNLFVLISFHIQSKYNPQFRYYNTNSTANNPAPSNVQAGSCTYGGNITNSTVIQLGNCGGNLYFIQLQLGSNKQTFNFQFDTGSNILWVPVKTANQTGFVANQSNTYNITNQTMNLSYADGSSASGNLGSDTITVGNTNISTTGLILFANNVQGMNFPSSVVGLVGMGFTPTANFFDLAFNNNQITTNVFSLKLMGNNATSLLYYNGGLPLQISQNTYWISQYQNNYWQVQVIGMFAGNTQLTSLASDAAIIDSGTSIFLLNQDLYAAVVQQFFSGTGCYQDNQQNLYCPCNSSLSWPTFSFMFIGVQVFIPASAYQQAIGNGSCLANFQNLDDVNSILLGDTFFRQYVVSFDKYNQQIGFYGNTKQIYVFDKQSFLISQYVMCALMFALGFLGFGLWIMSRFSINRNHVERSLGLELM